MRVYFVISSQPRGKYRRIARQGGRRVLVSWAYRPAVTAMLEARRRHA